MPKSHGFCAPDSGMVCILGFFAADQAAVIKLERSSQFVLPRRETISGDSPSKHPDLRLHFRLPDAVPDLAITLRSLAPALGFTVRMLQVQRQSVCAFNGKKTIFLGVPSCTVLLALTSRLGLPFFQPIDTIPPRLRLSL
jgi:hypothetical protein